MSTTDPQPGQITQLVFSIVSKGRKNNSLSSLTPRLVRYEVEKELGLPKNTLDVAKYRDIVKRAIQDAMQSEKTPGASASKVKKTGKNSSTPKIGESGRSSLSKSVKSKEVISDSDSAVEPTPSTSRSNVKFNKTADADEVVHAKLYGPVHTAHQLTLQESEPVRPSSKAKASKAVSAVAKRSPPVTKSAQSGPKRKRPSAPIVQSDSDPEFSDAKPKVSSSPHRIPNKNKNKSDSELSSLVDEPIKKKSRRKSASSDVGKPKAKSTRAKKPTQPLSKEEETIKELKGLVRACGVTRMWAKELNGLDLSSQITHIRKILSDLGMKGRMSIEQATRIRERREFAQELDDVQRFGKAIAAGKPFETRGTSKRVSKGAGDEDNKPDDDASGQESESASDRQQPVVNNARRSIMAFLQDQSSDND
jgi:hypothetical protein